MRKSAVQVALFVVLASLPPGHAQTSASRLAEEVRAAETAFARSMAHRDPAAFAAMVADEAVFFGTQGVLRGKPAVLAGWKRFFDGAVAPFSWAPGDVEVLASGTLGFSSGPVYDPKGQRIGTFNSVWQRQRDGSWKVVFDKGCPPCDCGAK